MAIPTHSHWYLLMGISIPVDTPSWCETIFSFFLSSPQPPFYSAYSAMSMAHTHVLREDWKSLRTSKVWNNCLACHRGYRSWEHLCVTKMKHGQTIWFCRDELSLAMLFWEDIIAFEYAWSIIIFMSILKFCLESFGSEHSCHNKENYIDNYVR